MSLTAIRQFFPVTSPKQKVLKWRKRYVTGVASPPPDRVFSVIFSFHQSWYLRALVIPLFLSSNLRALPSLNRQSVFRGGHRFLPRLLRPFIEAILPGFFPRGPSVV